MLSGGQRLQVRVGLALVSVRAEAVGAQRVDEIEDDVGPAFLVGREVRFALPAYPVENVIDPTGAGDCFAGGFMGHVAASGAAEPAALRKAMLFGTVTASFCVEGFGVEGLEHVDRSRLDARFQELASLVTP